MSLIVPSKLQKPELSEREALVRHGRERARKDFAQEEAENLIKESYDGELHRLRKGGPPVSQLKPAPHPNPPKSKQPSPIQKQLNLERSMRASRAPFVPVPKPVAPSLDSSEIDGPFALRVVQCWGRSSAARKDFSSVASFHQFCLESQQKDAARPSHLRGLWGIEYYERCPHIARRRK
ncbi:MAG: hypothetical protein R3B95_20670 [Nitrospirales bacterium]|nr:hypothetical protein [Nitrospirales bacterium]